MNMSGNGNGSWKNLAIGMLSTMLLTGLGAWFAFGQDVVRRDELSRLNANVQELSSAIVELKTTVAVLTERVGPRTGGTIR